LLGFANYEFDLKAPATGEVEAHLDMRVRDHQLLDYVDRLTPQEAEAFEAAYTLPEIFQPPYELDLDEIFPELVIIQDVIHKNGTGKTADFGEQADTQPVSAEQTQKVPVAKDPGDPQNE
jgi:hypothetical protein